MTANIDDNTNSRGRQPSHPQRMKISLKTLLKIPIVLNADVAVFRCLRRRETRSRVQSRILESEWTRIYAYCSFPPRIVRVPSGCIRSQLYGKYRHVCNIISARANKFKAMKCISPLMEEIHRGSSFDCSITNISGARSCFLTSAPQATCRMKRGDGGGEG